MLYKNARGDKNMYTSIVGSFLNSIQALKMYVDNVEPMQINMDRSIDSASLLAIIMSLAKDLKISKVNIEDIEFPEIIPEEIAKDIKEYLKDFGEMVELSQDGKSGRYSSIPKELKESYRKIEAIQKQNEILYSGSLMLLITYFENTISKIFKADLQRHPQRMSLENKSVSYKILEASKSIEDVKFHMIDNEVTTIMYKSFSDWIEYFKKNMKLNLKYVTEKKPIITEIIQRRNLIVHNEAIVNSVYINLVSKECRSNVKIGDILIVDRQYIYDAINLVETAGMALIIESWLNECQSNEDEIEKILSIIFEEYLIFEKWEVAKVLYEICLECKKLQTSDELICKINMWQCYKWLGKFEEVEDEVRSLDTSACSQQYKLGVMALLDEYEKFFRYFDKQNEISESHLKEWPIFRGIRESSAYKERYEIRE